MWWKNTIKSSQVGPKTCGDLKEKGLCTLCSLVTLTLLVWFIHLWTKLNQFQYPHYCPQTKAFISLKINDRPLWFGEKINFTPIFPLKPDPVIMNSHTVTLNQTSVSQLQCCTSQRKGETMVRRFKLCLFLVFLTLSHLSFTLSYLSLVSMSHQEAAPWTAHETSLPVTRHTSRSLPPEGEASCYHYIYSVWS